MNGGLGCPTCGGPLSPDILNGNCPRCLLEQQSDSPTVPPTSPEAREQLEPDALRHPERVGPYHILNLLGEGGMGIVYLVEQREPLRRKLALKLMKHGLDSRLVVKRFESERQALALMNHPGVAKVFDAGVSQDGRPYFVMEYVPGLPITDFCDRRELPVQDRLKLFIQVCDAIHHAHQKGLIHRDIKPSNVLVTEQDGSPVVKVIDFGVTKAAHQPLAQRTLFTEHGMMIGTPAYMSPEQSTADGLEVDTRTDIYSLGVLLYELLVGVLPVDPGTLKQAAIAELLRRIREEDPLKPTSKIEMLGETANDVARRRQTDARSLKRQLKGDLDWITMRALEKNPKRRYASVSEFAADVQRHLVSEPVLAGPPSLAYRVQKLARRHWVETAAVSAILLMLVVGVAVSTLFYFRAENERQRTQLDADAFEAALLNEPGRYAELARTAIAKHRESLGPYSIEFARHLAIHLAVSWDLPVNSDRQAWEQEALRITGRALDAEDLSAIDVWLVLSDVASDRSTVGDLALKALALLQRKGRTLNHADAQRLADLLDHGLNEKGAVESEESARQILRLRRETSTSDSPKVQAAVENLADTLMVKASAQSRRGELIAACPVYLEAHKLLQELQPTEGAYSTARLLELEAQFSACSPATREPSLIQIYKDLQTTAGMNSSATQTVLNRLVAFYSQARSAEANTYAARRPTISVTDLSDMGPVRYQQGTPTPGLDRAISLPFGQQSGWVMWNNQTSSTGLLVADSIRNHAPQIRLSSTPDAESTFIPLSASESTYNAQHSGPDCRVDCSSKWVLVPGAGVPDLDRQQALIFYSKTLLGLSKVGPATEHRAGVSLAVWRAIHQSTERPDVAPNTQEPTLLFGPDEPLWGTSAFTAEHLLYAYGCETINGNNLGMKCLLARVPLDRAFDRSAWQFYDGRSWNQNWRDAKPVMELPSVRLFSLHWNQYLDKFVATSTRALDHRIQIRVADRPEGPWSEPAIEIESLRPSIGLPFPWNGPSTAHPELSEENGRVEYLTYTRTTHVGKELRLIRVEFAKKEN